VLRARHQVPAILSSLPRASGWPDFGLTTAPSADNCCALLRTVLAGQMPGRWSDGCLYLYGSEGWGFESLRARHPYPQVTDLGLLTRQRPFVSGRSHHPLRMDSIRADRV
jgi:hypothetical protein